MLRKLQARQFYMTTGEQIAYCKMSLNKVRS